ERIGNGASSAVAKSARWVSRPPAVRSGEALPAKLGLAGTGGMFCRDVDLLGLRCHTSAGAGAGRANRLAHQGSAARGKTGDGEGEQANRGPESATVLAMVVDFLPASACGAWRFLLAHA